VDHQQDLRTQTELHHALVPRDSVPSPTSFLIGTKFIPSWLLPAQHELTVHFAGEGLNALAQLVGDLGQFCVLLEQFHHSYTLFGRQRQPQVIGPGKVFAMLGVGIRVGFVAIRLAGLRQQDEGCRIGGLEAECEIE